MLAECLGNNFWLVLFKNRSIILVNYWCISPFALEEANVNVRAVSAQAAWNVGTLRTGRECLGHCQ
jgi:hypothetical protein